MMTQIHDALLDVAQQMADAARAAILPHFRNSALTAENKLDGGYDPVTIADRAAEEAMRAVLADLRPDDAILGEEFGAVDGTSGLTWVLDPIDGTRGFVSGTPTWGVLIAVGGPDGPEIGIIDQPYIGERFIGTPEAAWLHGPGGRHPCRPVPPVRWRRPRSLRPSPRSAPPPTPPPLRMWQAARG